ncbi:hypothetical protein C8J57DRAFT_1476150, partial [Mycena rebaudengoi]
MECRGSLALQSVKGHDKLFASSVEHRSSLAFRSLLRCLEVDFRQSANYHIPSHSTIKGASLLGCRNFRPNFPRPADSLPALAHRTCGRHHLPPNPRVWNKRHRRWIPRSALPVALLWGEYTLRLLICQVPIDWHELPCCHVGLLAACCSPLDRSSGVPLCRVLRTVVILRQGVQLYKGDGKDNYVLSLNCCSSSIFCALAIFRDHPDPEQHVRH